SDAGAHGLAFLAGGVGLGTIIPQPYGGGGVIAQAGDGLAAAQEQKRRCKKGKSAWRAHETVLILKNRWRRPLCPTGRRSPTWLGLTSSGRPHRFAARGWAGATELKACR